MTCRALWKITSDESFHSDVLFETDTSFIQLKNQKIKTLNLSSVMENFPKMNDKKFELSVSANLCERTWIVP